MTKLIFDKTGCKSFFKKYPNSQKLVSSKIQVAIDKEIQTGMTKVKFATSKKINDFPCYEMRLNVGKIGSIRIAFSVKNEKAMVYYLTTTLQKSEFSKEFDKVINKK